MPTPLDAQGPDYSIYDDFPDDVNQARPSSIPSILARLNTCKAGAEAATLVGLLSNPSSTALT
jgi:hypothetical protein